MSAFKRIHVKNFAQIGPQVTADTLYWSKLVPVVVQEFGQIDYIDVSPVEPFFFAVTCSSRVQIYNPITNQNHRTLSRFNETAYGGSFRSDGKLLCAGGDDSHIKLFDVNTRTLLRIFKGHTGTVHRCKFTQDTTHIVSFSDDKSVKLWDIPKEEVLHSYQDHHDYIRAGCVSQASPDIFLSGSYDHKVKMYDIRSDGCVFSVDHGSPVESILMFPSGGVFLSAGGTELKVWDAIAGGKLLAKISQHHKTITCLHFASDGKRLLSGSLDSLVKVYDVMTYQVVHTLEYPSPVLSLGVAKGDQTVITGMVNGLVSICHRQEEKTMKDVQWKRKKSFWYTRHADLNISTGDIIVSNTRKKKSSAYEYYLRTYQYSLALDAVLTPSCRANQPDITVSLIQELIRRDGLKRAMAGREGKSLTFILMFLIKYISDIRFMRVLIDVANMLLDIYSSCLDQSVETEQLFLRLRNQVDREVQYMKDLMDLQGAVDLVLSASNVRNRRQRVNPNTLLPSDSAESKFIINLS